MIMCVIGLDADEATVLLEAQGLLVRRLEYVSRRGVEGADATRVIRQRMIGDNGIEITVSHFKTQIG